MFGINDVLSLFLVYSIKRLSAPPLRRHFRLLLPRSQRQPSQSNLQPAGCLAARVRSQVQNVSHVLKLLRNSSKGVPLTAFCLAEGP